MDGGPGDDGGGSGGSSKEPCVGFDEQKERDQLNDSPPLTLPVPHCSSKPCSLAAGDGDHQGYYGHQGYSADDSSMDEDLKDSDIPHMAEVQSSKPKPRFKGRYNVISRLFLL